MALYARKDSPFWWMLLEGANHRASTGIPRHGGSPAQDRELYRQAETVYAAAKTESAKAAAGLIKPAAAIISYRDWATWYETHHAQHHRGAVRELSMLTRIAQYFDRYASLADIDAHGIREWMTMRAKQVAKSTVNRELDVLKVVLKMAVPKYLAVNPASEVRRFRLAESEPRVLTREEEARLLSHADAYDRAWLITALDTLLRLSSVVQLQWAQVKLDQGVIVPLNAKVSLDAVPISTRLDLALRALPRPSAYVFAPFHRAPRGGATAAVNQAIRQFDRLCALAHVPHGRRVGGITFHCLRHTGATRALQSGHSVRTVMKLGGWKDERTVMRYVHAADSDVRNAAESIGLTIVARTG